MTATCGSTKRTLIGTCALSCFVFLICSTFTGVVAEPRITSPLPQPTSKQRGFRNQSQNGNARHKSSYHRPLTPEQKADQNLQFMLSLYRSAAEPDGRLKQYRKFGSNTVRLLKPSVSSLHYLTASREHHYTFTVEYSLDSLPLEQLIRASFLHFRSSSSSSSWGPGAFHLPPCRARVASLGVLHHAGRPPPGESVPLQLHHQWTETDVTAHVSRHILQRTNQTSLTLMAQYRCTDPGSTDQAGDPSWWSRSSKAPSPSGRRRMVMMRRLRGRRRRRRWSHMTGDVSGYHLEAPSLLLYLEERREGQDWMKELLAGEDESAAPLWPPPSSAFRRPRRSATDPPEEFPPGAKALSSTVLKVVAAAAAAASSSSSPNSSSSSSSSSSSASTSPASPWSGDTYEAVPGMPNYRRKTSMPRDRCRLRSLRLSFEALGLGHYFIAPPVYNPRYCQGECPSVLHHGYHASNHAIIQTVMRELGVSDDVPAPSCVPYRYMPMSVLVRNKKRVEYRELEDMIAESCTCR